MTIDGLGAGVPTDNGSVQGFADDGVKGRLDDGRQLRELFFGPSALGNIPAGGKHVRARVEGKVDGGNGGVTVFTGLSSETKLDVTDLALTAQISHNFSIR